MFGIQYPLPAVIFCGNQGSTQISIDLVQRKRNKYIKIHMYYVRESIYDRVISLQYFSIEQQVVDIFTKSFTENIFSKLRAILGVVETTEKNTFGHLGLFPLIFLWGEVPTSFSLFPHFTRNYFLLYLST